MAHTDVTTTRVHGLDRDLPSRWPPSLVVGLLWAFVGGCPQNDPPPPDTLSVTFPTAFSFGTATAGWQSEGDLGSAGPTESNWSRWLGMGKAKGDQQNPDGNGFRTQYADDIARAADLGLQTFRLSVDWSKVAPTRGAIDEAELDHLDDVVDAVRAAGMEPVLTLYHWVVPPWVQNPDASAPGGAVDLLAQKDHAVVDDWEQFVTAVVARVGDRVDTYTVLNEPLTMVVVGYIDGRFPPGAFLDIPRATDFGIQLLYMQARAYDVIHALDTTDADGDGTVAFAGVTMTANEIYPEHPESAQEQLAAESLNYVYNDWFIQALTTGDLDVNLDGAVDPAAVTLPAEGRFAELAGRTDFIGVQYYGPVLVTESPFLDEFAPLYGLPLTDVASYTTQEGPHLPHNAMGREIRASGFADALKHYAKWRLPLLITENGTTTNIPPPEVPVGEAVALPPPDYDEDQAAMYVVTHLWEVGRARAAGVDVRGFSHWTIADNFEWVDGTLQRFGLYSVDFDAPERPRRRTRMADALADIVAARGIDLALWNAYVRDRFASDTTAAGVGPTTVDTPR